MRFVGDLLRWNNTEQAAAVAKAADVAVVFVGTYSSEGKKKNAQARTQQPLCISTDVLLGAGHDRQSLSMGALRITKTPDQPWSKPTPTRSSSSLRQARC